MVHFERGWRITNKLFGFLSGASIIATAVRGSVQRHIFGVLNISSKNNMWKKSVWVCWILKVPSFHVKASTTLKLRTLGMFYRLDLPRAAHKLFLLFFNYLAYEVR